MAFSILFITVWFIYICLIAVILYCCHRFIKLGRLGKCILGIILLMIPFWQDIMVETILLNYKFHNSPLQVINRTVEKPGSVFWFDEVWPGFDDLGQRNMIENYLDGVHLKTLAMNDGKGNVNVYQAVADDYAASKKLYLPWQEAIKKEEERLKDVKRLGNLGYNKREKLLKEKDSEYYRLHMLLKEQRAEVGRLFNLFRKQLKEDISQIMKRAQSYRLSEFLDQYAHEFNYKIAMHRQRLPEWQEEYAWADKITIYDVRKNEVVGYSKRSLVINTTYYWFLDVKDIIPYYRKYSSGIGDYMAYDFDDKVLFRYAVNWIGSFGSNRIRDPKRLFFKGGSGRNRLNR